MRVYRGKGPDAVTRMLLSALQSRPLRGSDLLDVGAGIGVITAELAGEGVARATVVEASPAYLDVARQVVGSRYGEGLASFVFGNFSEIAGTLPGADVVTMGRVVCCYPDAENLLKSVSAKARRILAFTYPRDSWHTRALNWMQNLLRKMRKNTFRTYIHSAAEMEDTLTSAGFVRSERRKTLVWVLDLYERR